MLTKSKYIQKYYYYPIMEYKRRQYCKFVLFVFWHSCQKTNTYDHYKPIASHCLNVLVLYILIQA